MKKIFIILPISLFLTTHANDNAPRSHIGGRVTRLDNPHSTVMRYTDGTITATHDKNNNIYSASIKVGPHITIEYADWYRNTPPEDLYYRLEDIFVRQELAEESIERDAEASSEFASTEEE